jgi:hypothetical protein
MDSMLGLRKRKHECPAQTIEYNEIDDNALNANNNNIQNCYTSRQENGACESMR